MMVGRKLVVEVVAAKALMPKDGQGSANAYCVLDYAGQRRRTRVKHKDLDPTWNERFEFGVSGFGTPGDLEITIQNERNSGTTRFSRLLGRVTIPISEVPNRPDAIRWYPLQKRGLFSHIKGDLGLRIWWQKAEGSPHERFEREVGGGGGYMPDERHSPSDRAQADKQPDPPRPHVPDTDFSVKHTHPDLGKAVDYRPHFDLVEQMTHLFVRVVKARDLLGKGQTGSRDPYAKVSVGPVKVDTRIVKQDLNPEWNQVFSFGRDKIQGTSLELSVRDADKISNDDFLGGFMIDLQEVPARMPPEPPLSPAWFKLEAKTGKGNVRGEIMVALWWGTQADEAFSEAWQTDTGGYAQFHSKVYLAPKLWYLRVNVIETQDLATRDLSELFVRVSVDPFQSLRTRPAPGRNGSAFWNEDLMFVAAEPFVDMMYLSVEDGEEILGHVRIPLGTIDRRINGRPLPSRWYVVEREGGEGGPSRGRIHLRLCLEGGYHVMDESPRYISDTRPTATQLWRHPLGVLELGIHGAKNLIPMKVTKDSRGCTDAYCIAKYGPKWVRTRTIVDSFRPRWNEQYTWEVHEPSTVLTVGVFDNSHTVPMGPGVRTKHLPLGKVRIRLCTLESDRVYTNAYPLLVVTPQGVKKMGDLELAVRFSCVSAVNLMQAYLQPQLPRMHYFYPLGSRQAESLAVVAMNVVALKLMRSEPPVQQEVVQFMMDTEQERWSMRRSKANYYRIMAVLNGLFGVMNWFSDVCNWKSPHTTVLVHVLYLILVWYPELFLPTMFLYLFLIGSWNFRFRPQSPPFMDAKLSQGEHNVNLDELEEEFDVVPANRAHEVLKYRYERLRALGSRIQSALGDLASIGEKFHSLLSWRDPRASILFVAFCLVSAIVLYVTPFQMVAVVLGVYALRHPRFRDPRPSMPLSLFKRLPSQADRII